MKGDILLGEFINWDYATVEECIEGFEKCKREYLINDGHIIGFDYEDKNYDLYSRDKRFW